MFCLTLPVKNIRVFCVTMIINAQGYKLTMIRLSEEIMEKEKHSQSESVKSQKSYASRLSVSSSKACEAHKVCEQ